ncbi:hypothetical protein JKA74_02810 [Marivirga sp. S37H4]|uniref:DUF4760 domain-containing protein n=1 Tax=Marivirga aurantiaca TaxID=2802615 RepID=A0A934WW12_9BACT|nr:hypothetical protein [Marivirga aurantiaca]MBK6263955.1 hypothetical protein [Marivirga aurantiaca]
MDDKFIITSIITVSLAISGYLAKYFNDIRLAKRKDKLDRINRQLKEFYGPLFSLTASSNASWIEFRKKNRTHVKGYFDQSEPPTKKELELWRTWICTVFQPINNEIYHLILKNGDLIIENNFPKPLSDLCAHFESYKPIISQWSRNDFSEHLSLLNYPTSILEYAEKSYNKLKQEQNKLIG